MKNNYKEALNDIINSKEKNVLECLSSDSYWKKRAQAAEDVVKYWNSLGQVVRDDILHKWQSLVTSPVAEAEGQDELKR